MATPVLVTGSWYTDREESPDAFPAVFHYQFFDALTDNRKADVPLESGHVYRTFARNIYSDSVVNFGASLFVGPSGTGGAIPEGQPFYQQDMARGDWQEARAFAV